MHVPFGLGKKRLKKIMSCWLRNKVELLRKSQR